MKRRRVSWWVLAIPLLGGCGADPEPGAGGEDVPTPPSLRASDGGLEVVVSLTEHQATQLAIRTVEAVSEHVEYAIDLPGTVTPAPDAYAEVAAPISGRIVRLLAHEGEAVRKDQVLAELESLELADLVAEALQARAELDYQAKQVDRFETLVDRKIRPASTLEKARADLARAEAMENAAHARLHAIGVGDAQLELWNSDEARPLLELRAPIEGVIAEHRIELGQPVTAYQTMMTVVDPAVVRIQGFLAPEDVGAVRVGDPVAIRAEDGTGREIEAAVLTVNPSLDPGSRAVTVNVEVASRGGWPIPGETVRLAIRVRTPGPVLSVPLDAVEYEGAIPTVFVQRDALHWERRPVSLGRVTEEFAFVIDGLADGERVAVSQVFTLKALARFEQYGEEGS